MLELTEKAFNTQLSEHFKMVARVPPHLVLVRTELSTQKASSSEGHIGSLARTST